MMIWLLTSVSTDLRPRNLMKDLDRRLPVRPLQENWGTTWLLCQRLPSRRPMQDKATTRSWEGQIRVRTLGLQHHSIPPFRFLQHRQTFTLSHEIPLTSHNPSGKTFNPINSFRKDLRICLFLNSHRLKCITTSIQI